MNKISFKDLSKRQKIILLNDLCYIQNKLKPYNAIYSIYATVRHRTITYENKSLTIGGWLGELNNASTNLVAIAWKQIVLGTYRTQLSPLPLYQQLINRYLIDLIATQDPRIIYANKSEINVEANNIDVSITKEPIFVSPDKVQDIAIYNFTLTDGKGTQIFFLNTNNKFKWHKFALNWERKWFKSSQEQWAMQAYAQIQAFDAWYKHIESFPLINKILRHDFIHSKYWNVQIKNKTFLYLYNNDLIRDLPSQHAINSALILLAEINQNGINHKEKKWLRRNTVKHQLVVWFDIAALRTSLAIFVRNHRTLIQQLSNTAKLAEKITPDKIYQNSINEYFHYQYDNNKDKFEYDRYYRVPGTDLKIEVINGNQGQWAEDGFEGQYDVRITNPQSETLSLIVSKQSQGWIANWMAQDRIFDLKTINKSTVASQIVAAWSHSNAGKETIIDYKKLRAFYDHTAWLLSLAYIPRFARNYSKKYSKGIHTFEAQHKFIYNNKTTISHDLNYLFALNFKGLSERKKAMMVTDYYLFAVFDLQSLRHLITHRWQFNGNGQINSVYKRLSSLAEASMKITPAEIYQREFDANFGLNKWIKTWNQISNDILVSNKEVSSVSSNGSQFFDVEFDVEILTPNRDNTIGIDLVASKSSGNLVIESFNYANTGYGAKLWIEPSYHYFQFNYTSAPGQKNRQFEIGGIFKSGLEIKTNKETLNMPSIHTIDSEVQIKSLVYLTGFLQNSLVKRMVDTYVRRHHKIDKVVKWLPNSNRLETTISWASSINFKELSRKEKLLLYLDYYRIAYVISAHYQKLSRAERSFLSQDIRLLVDLSDILQTYKIIPGTHGRIDHAYDIYGKDYGINSAIAQIRKDIYDIKHPKPHKRPWKQWKTWNERVYSLMNLTRVFWLVAEFKNTFYTIEKNALTQAYKTYHSDLAAGDSKNESIKYADRAYVNSLYLQDKTLWSRYIKAKKFSKSSHFGGDHGGKLLKDSIEEIYYRQVVTAKKLFHIQNDRYLRKLRLEDYLLKQIIEEQLAISYIANYQKIVAKEQKLIKHGHVYDFFRDLGLAVWDLVKTPFVMVIVTWKDIASGDGFFKSWDSGLEAGVRSIKKSINYLAKDVKDLFFLVDGLLLDCIWVGKNSIFRWCRDFSWIHTVDHDLEMATFYLEMGGIFIAKSLIEIPLHLAKDVNKLAIGLVLFAEGKITFKHMIYNDVEPIFHTVERLSKFLDHIFTDPKIIKHKIGHVKTLLHLMKLKQEAKYVLRIDRFDRHTRRRLHHQTFGIIKSPFEKFKQRHKGLYYELKLTNKHYIESGYFTSHPDEAIAEDQLDAIYRAQVRLNGLSHETDLQRLSHQLKDQYSSKWHQLSVAQKLLDIKSFKSDSAQQQTKLIKKFIIKDLESYYDITGQRLNEIKTEDEKGLHLLVKKEGKLHLASFTAKVFEDWMNSIIKRQRHYVHAYSEIIANHPNFALDLLELDRLSALYADVRKEQKHINSEWDLWGKRDGKMLFKALTLWFLPEFAVSKGNSSKFFGLELPFTISVYKDSNGSFVRMPSKQKNQIKKYDNNHHIGHKVFDMIMWTYFLDKHNKTKLPALKWFTSNKLDPLSPVAAYTKKITSVIHDDEQHDLIHKHYKKYYHGFLKTYAIYSKNFNLINAILDAPIESLNKINASLKQFATNTGVSGFYKTLFQQILQYDYDNKEYHAWLSNMAKYNQSKLTYLKDDKYVLGYEVSQGDTVTVLDVLQTFTLDGEANTTKTYDQLNGIVTPPTPPAPSPTPNPKKELVKIDREIRVNPIALFKNYEFVKHVSKAISNKSVKADAAALKKKTLVDGKAELKNKETSIIKNESSEEIDSLSIDLDETVTKSVDHAFTEIDGAFEAELDATLGDIEVDIEILEGA